MNFVELGFVDWFDEGREEGIDGWVGVWEDDEEVELEEDGGWGEELDDVDGVSEEAEVLVWE